jgi:hypothetical protein
MSQTNSAKPAAIDADERSAAAPTVRSSEGSRSSPEDGFPPATTSPAIHAVGLSKRFGDTIAVNSLSMTVQRGEKSWTGLGRFGQWHRKDKWTTVEGVDPSRITELVSELVSLGGQAEAVIPEHQTLEARFRELLEER